MSARVGGLACGDRERGVRQRKGEAPGLTSIDGERGRRGLLAADGEEDEDSAEVIDSRGEEEGEEEEGEEEAPEVGADGQPQVDRASSNEPRPSKPAATGGDQAETDQPAAPPTGATNSSDPSNPSGAP